MLNHFRNYPTTYLAQQRLFSLILARLALQYLDINIPLPGTNILNHILDSSIMNEEFLKRFHEFNRFPNECIVLSKVSIVSVEWTLPLQPRISLRYEPICPLPDLSFLADLLSPDIMGGSLITHLDHPPKCPPPPLPGGVEKFNTTSSTCPPSRSKRRL